MVDLKKIKDKISEKEFVKKVIIILVVGIIFMIVGEFGVNDRSEEKLEEETKEPLQSQSMEREMEEVLASIEGAGRVKVMITYKTSREVIREFEKKEIISDTKEDDGGGGSKLVQQREISDSITFEESNGCKRAVVRKEIEPEIKGVVVVADGACDDNVRKDLQMAAKVLTGVPVHKISVFAMENK